MKRTLVFGIALAVVAVAAVAMRTANGTVAVALTGVQGQNGATYTNGTAVQGTYLILYGTFGSSGNEVAIDGGAASAANVTYQSANQINVSLASLAVGSHTVAVATPSGTTGSLPFMVTAPAASVPTVSLTGVQGYNPSTGAQTATVQEGGDLALSGVFGSSGNVVSIITGSSGGGVSGGTSSGVTIVSQSASQIIVSLAGLAPGSYTVVVATPSGTTSYLPLTVEAASVPTPGGNASQVFTINSGAGGSYAVGQAWVLVLNKGPANTLFTMCAIDNGVRSCTPDWGTTDALGFWTQPGIFPSSTIGSWTEWVSFPSGATSNQITFTVAAASTTTQTTGTSTPNILTELQQSLQNIQSSLVSGTDLSNDNLTSAQTVVNSLAQIIQSLASTTTGSGLSMETSGTTARSGPTNPLVQSASPQITPPATASTLIGPYFWTGSVSGVANSSIMAKGDTLTDGLGARVVRIFMSPKSDMDYQGGSCIPNFTLTNLAKRADFNKILSDPQFTTVIITAYDGVSFGDCATKSYYDQTFYTAANTQKIEQEYTDFANYLKTFNKTFIIDNWEGDNDAYCSGAYAVAMGNATCPGASNALAGLQKWFQARYAGIHASGASNVFDAIEFNIVRALANAHLPSVLYNVIPNVSADYYSYSSYESINVSSGQLGVDIDTIRAVTNNAPLIIGEIGFKVGDFGAAAATADRLGQMLGVVQEKNVPYAIVWSLLDSPPGFGLYDSSGNITASGRTVENLIGNSSASVPVITGVQGYDPGTEAYTNGTVVPGTYIILYGNFGASGNTVRVNGNIVPASDITYQGPTGAPTAAAPDQINISLSTSTLNQAPFWLNVGSPNTITVMTSGGVTTAPASFMLIPLNEESTTSTAALSITVPGATSTGYTVNAPWTLTLNSSVPNKSFTICAIQNGVQSCTPNWGTTDANGNWATTGTFPSSTVGAWTEWIQFPNFNLNSNRITFTVAQPH